MNGGGKGGGLGGDDGGGGAISADMPTLSIDAQSDVCRCRT